MKQMILISPICYSFTTLCSQFAHKTFADVKELDAAIDLYIQMYGEKAEDTTSEADDFELISVESFCDRINSEKFDEQEYYAIPVSFKEENYIVMEDSFWNGDEAHNIHGVYANKADAIKRLAEEKEYFLKSVNYKEGDEDYNIEERPTYFKIDDTFGGDYFEICVVTENVE